MNQQLSQAIIDLITREQEHFSHAPTAFFKAWKHGAALAGPEWFGEGTCKGLQQAADKWALRPRMMDISEAINVLSSGQRLFLSVMVSFYNGPEGAVMLRRCGFEGFADLNGLDLERRQVIADLVLHHTGW